MSWSAMEGWVLAASSVLALAVALASPSFSFSSLLESVVEKTNVDRRGGCWAGWQEWCKLCSPWDV